MAKYKKLEVLQTVSEQAMMPLFYNADLEVAKQVVKACYDGGARLLEFTNRGDFAHEVFGELNKYAVKELPGLILGIGSVNDAGTASLYMQLGANFIVSASLREDIAKVCNRRKVPYMPGCGTLTEVGKAEELGCDIVKLFPGSVYGPEFIKAISGPQPWTTIMPTGGVAPTEENLNGWFGAGAVCVGMGSKLLSKTLVSEGKYSEIQAKVAEALALVAKVRS